MGKRNEFKDDPARPDLDRLKEYISEREHPSESESALGDANRKSSTAFVAEIQNLPAADIAELIEYVKRTMGEIVVEGLIGGEYQFVAGTVVINRPDLAGTVSFYMEWFLWLENERKEAIYRVERTHNEARHKRQELMREGGSKKVQ